MPRSNWAREPQLLSLRVWSVCSATGEATTVRGPRTAKKKKRKKWQKQELPLGVWLSSLEQFDAEEEGARTLGLDRSEFKSEVCHFPTVCPGASHLTSLSFHFLTWDGS